MDIGSNVGELLINFANKKIKVCGVDPAKNIAKKAIKRGIPTITEFFGKEIENTLIKKKIFPKIITGTNVFAHINDIEGSVKVIKNILKPDGVLVIEAPYLKNLIAGLEYDTIYHEHLMYLSINPMINLFKKFEFEIFDIQFKDIHGGSIRVFVKHKDGPFRISSKIKRISDNEIKEKLNSTRTLSKFSKQVESHRKKLRSLLKRLKSNGKKIACVGAPAKGMTLLNYNKLNNDIIEFVTEVSKLKLNKYCPGTDLKIVDDNKLIANNIDYALILPWNFKNEIMKNLKDFKKSGGRFIIPLPKIQIV
jgi:SAM-dependent methyltransferase